MNRGATSEKVHTVTSVPIGLKNLNREQDTTVTFTHVDHSVVRFDDKLDVKLENIDAEYESVLNDLTTELSKTLKEAM